MIIIDNSWTKLEKLDKNERKLFQNFNKANNQQKKKPKILTEQ